MSLLINAASFLCSEIGISQSNVGWKPYGTPLVSPICCDDVTTRGDIQLIVHRMLSPMLRAENPGFNCVSRSKTAAAAAANASRLAASSEACVDSSLANDDPRQKDVPSSKLVNLEKLPLQLVDENNACIDLTVGEDKSVKLSSSSVSILVFADWSQKLLENYDTRYIENLPEVTKYGPATKKARTEPLSLYSCLEAFLREEPLVPEDMWLVSSCSHCSCCQNVPKKETSICSLYA